MTRSGAGAPPWTGALRALAVLSILELVTICALLANLLTVHVPVVSHFLGPCHGALYLCVAAVALFARGLLLRTRVLALIPVLGGVLTLINVSTERHRLASHEASTPKN